MWKIEAHIMGNIIDSVISVFYPSLYSLSYILIRVFLTQLSVVFFFFIVLKVAFCVVLSFIVVIIIFWPYHMTCGILVP